MKINILVYTLDKFLFFVSKNLEILNGPSVGLANTTDSSVELADSFRLKVCTTPVFIWERTIGLEYLYLLNNAIKSTVLFSKG